MRALNYHPGRGGQCRLWLINRTFNAHPHHVRFTAVVSTGRRNTCIKSFCWGLKFQSFMWLVVELTHRFDWVGFKDAEGTVLLGKD